MPSAYRRPCYLMMVLTIAATGYATASESLFADEPVRASTQWISDLVNYQTTTRPDSDLPVPTEDVETPAVPESPDKSHTQRALATDKPATTDNQKHSSNSPEQARCFVAAPMASLTIDVSLPSGLLPEDVAAACAATTVPRGDSRLHGGWAQTDHHWSATCQCHQPLYFEEIGVERYGHTSAYCLQPLISAGRFFLTIPALPYKMAVDCPCDGIFTLGHYRPGTCAPWRLHHLSCQAGAAIVQAGFVASLILLIP